MEERIHSAPGDEIEQAKPVVVSRYRGFTRVNHWVTAICMIVLLLSGFSFFHPSLYFLTGLFGGGQTTRWLHPIVGLVMVASFFLLFVQMWKLNLPTRDDVEWSKKIGDVIQGHDENLPELGKYNAGQKLVFWGMSVLNLAMIITGIMIWEQYFPNLVSIPTRRVALAIHALAALGSMFIFIMHVYAAIWTRGTIRAMTRGTVTGGWAYRHHRKWLRELAERRGSEPAGESGHKT